MLGPAVLLLLALAQLFFLPQTYTAVASVSVMQSQAASPLAALAGQTEPHKYIGVLQSRALAEQVESKIHLQQLYNLPTHRKAVEKLMQIVQPDDNANEGLLYVSVSLAGPPKWAPGAELRREDIENAAAAAANTYVAGLRRFYSQTDNDKDSVLLRAGSQALARAEADYNSASHAVMNFVVSLRNVPIDRAPAGTGDNSSVGPNVITSLLTSEDQLNGRIQAAEAAKAATLAGTNRLLSHAAQMPEDDPLLMTSRYRLDTAIQRLKQLRESQQLGEDNPQVVQAKQDVAIAAAALATASNAALRGLTSASVKTESDIQSLIAERNAIAEEIHQEAVRMPVRRELTETFRQLEANQEIALSKLKEVEAKAADLQLSAVSGNSRVTSVDTALPPDSSTPGYARILLSALALVLVLFCGAVGLDYLQRARKQAVIDRELEESALAGRPPELTRTARA